MSRLIALGLLVALQAFYANDRIAAASRRPPVSVAPIVKYMHGSASAAGRYSILQYRAVGPVDPLMPIYVKHADPNMPILTPKGHVLKGRVSPALPDGTYPAGVVRIYLKTPS